MKHLELDVDVLQDHVLLLARDGGKFRIKAVVCPYKDYFGLFMWEGDGKTSNIFDTNRREIPSLSGFRIQAVSSGALGCMAIAETRFELAGKSTSIKLLDAGNRKPELDALGLSSNFTNDGIFCVIKGTAKKINSGGSRITNSFVRLTDKLHEFGEEKTAFVLTEAEINNLENGLTRLS
jgi:hypothetical protein